MKKFFLFSALLITAHSLIAQDYPITPVSLTKVSINGGFWGKRLETNRTVTLPYAFKQCEETGRIDNFAVAGGLKKGTFQGYRFNDSDVFKVIEGAAYSLQTNPDPKLDQYLDNLIKLIAAAQEPDGYLYTERTIYKDSTGKKDPYAGATRFSFEAGSHELYNVGHLYEAAVAHYQATGKRSLLDVAIKNANYLVSTIGPDKLVVVPGHQEIEIGLVKLYRVTNDKRYLNLSRFFLDMRGRADKRELFPDEARSGKGSAELQDHIPVVKQREAVGHAVRAEYMYTAMTDIAAIEHDTAYQNALNAIWTDVVSNKQYITGGVGNRENGEAFGQPYVLPNDAAYAETCAAVANLLWNHRMFLLTGQSKYMDVFERTLYNGFLAGVSIEGNKFFYVNRLASDGKRRPNANVLAEREPWFGTSCCPTNVVRFMPALPGYVYATKDDNLFVNLFMTNTADLTVNNVPVRITQQTNYPWDGAIALTVSPKQASTFTLRIRIPGWAVNQPMPGKLYTYGKTESSRYTLIINGKAIAPTIEDGYAVIRRNWQADDSIALTLTMPVRQVLANPNVKEDQNRIAIERGPIVYCAEGVDNGGKALSIIPYTALTPEFRPQLLGGLTVLTGKQLTSIPTLNFSTKPLTLIPYYAWANRGANEMAVWFGLVGK